MTTVVLKNNNNLTTKIKGLVSRTGDSHLSLVISQNQSEEVLKVFDELGLGVLKYAGEKMYIGKTGIKITILTVQEYI